MQIILEGHERPIPVEAGDTILASLLRAGVPFPFSCQAGNCGTCKCELVSGDVLELEHSEHALAPAERAKGVILACRTQAWDDTTIRRLDAEELVMHPSRVMRCRVSAIEAPSPDIRVLRLAIEAGGPFVFSAGQYAELEFAPGLSRHYSMANTPAEAELEFHVQRQPGGRTSGYIAQSLKAGDRLKVCGPLGVSYLRDAHAGPVLLVAAGSGLAPMLSILRTLLARGYRDAIALHYAGDLYQRPLLERLAAAHANFSLRIVSGARELATAVASWLARTPPPMAYLAGTPDLVEAATAALATGGLAPRRIHADAFYNQT